jgi:pimeloyl-ACP methyl ester carboxylesterase
MHAIDRFRRPRPAAFILGSDDPYLPVERGRPSIDQIAGATLHEVPGGHAPWLIGPHRVAGLIATSLTVKRR